MTKAYNRINWQNEPSTDTALNEQNLNKMDRAIDVIDDRVCAMEESVQAKVDEAGDKVDDAEAQAKLAESWAKGDTGNRQGENTNNSKYYSLQAKAEANRAKQYAENAEAVTGVEIATTAKAGIVKPDGTSITVDPDGTIHAAGGGGGATEWNNIENKPETFPPSAHQHVVADITDLPEWAKSADKPTYTASEVGAVAITVVGDGYSESASYSAGDYCIYNNTLYKCLVACVGQTPTNTTYWMATSVTNELKTKNIVTTEAPTAGETSTYPVGTTIDVIE